MNKLLLDLELDAADINEKNHDASITAISQATLTPQINTLCTNHNEPISGSKASKIEELLTKFNE